MLASFRRFAIFMRDVRCAFACAIFAVPAVEGFAAYLHNALISLDTVATKA